jgi:KUP system potassium uptake protein
LYAFRECFHGDYGIAVTPQNVLGVLSLMFWALMIIVTAKYLVFMLRADNHGEGGVIALAALISQSGAAGVKKGFVLLAMGLFGASLLYGDGMITPAISVLSAVEGITIIAPVFEPYVIPATIGLLVGLFVLQRRGTRGVGILFGPVTLVWFCVLAVLGLRSLLRHPQIVFAINPWHAFQFILRNHMPGFLVLGAVFLVVTGAEALYADMGHFGRRPIRLAWGTVVLPALLINYFGQGALLLYEPELASHPFYALAPHWALIPLVVMATAATIIASQAIISAAFSLTRQAIQLGYLPRLKIVHTSTTEMGQVYIPQVNWLLMIGTIALVLGFGSSSKLAAAYGVAVTTTMLIETVLFYVVARKRWGWSRLAAGGPVILFAVVDLSFFSANISKITHGAWFPLLIGAFVYLLLTTWRKGRSILADKLYSKNPTLEDFVAGLAASSPARVPGKAVFLAGNPSAAPPALVQNLKHNKIIHDATAILTIKTEEIPKVPRDEKVTVKNLGQSIYVITARYGFMEDPNVPHVLALAREKGLDFSLEDISFFIGRERIMPDRKPLMPVWRERIFSFLSRNAVGATAFFHIPPEQVVEFGSQVEI